jgi:hypothetical protein
LSLDNASLSINNLTFVVCKASNWRRLVRKQGAEPATTTTDEQGIEPISLAMDFGIETTSAAEAVPRVCVFGVIPLIALNLSPSQLSRMLSVSRAWTKVLEEMSPQPTDKNAG